MPIILYQLERSPPVRTVLIAADILGLTLETRYVDILNGDTLKPEFVEKNPVHKVPVIEDDDFILSDSHAIIIYLVSKYGGEKASELYPEDVQQRAIVHQRLFLDASILFPRLSNIIRGIIFAGEPGVTKTKAADVEEAYGFLEKYLQTTSFLACDHMTIADLSCVTTVSSLNSLVPIKSNYPKLREWLDKLSHEDWYKNKNMPGHNNLLDVINYYTLKNTIK